MANFTLARRDSYVDYLNVGIKQVTLTFLRNSPLHMSSLFADHIIAKAEEQIHQHIDRLSSGPSHKKRSRYHPYNQPDKQAPEIWSTSMKTVEPRKTEQERLRQGLPTIHSHWPRDRVVIIDDYCVTQKDLIVARDRESVVNVTRKKDIFGKLSDFKCKLTSCRLCTFCCRAASKEMHKS